MSPPMRPPRQANAGFLIAVSLVLCCPSVSASAGPGCGGDFASFLYTANVSQWSCQSQATSSERAWLQQKSTVRDLTFGMKEASPSKFTITANYDPSSNLRAHSGFVLRRDNDMNPKTVKEGRTNQQTHGNPQRHIEWDEFTRFGWTPEDALLAEGEQSTTKSNSAKRGVTKKVTSTKANEELLARRDDAEFDVLSIEDLTLPAPSGSKAIFDASENTSTDPLRLKNWDLNSAHTIRIGSLRR